MKTQIIDKTGKKKGEIELPKNFSSGIRPDILLKAYEIEKKSLMTPWGAKPGAGRGYSASGILRHRRHAWKTTYGKGISRVPRKILSRHGDSFNWVGATIASARGGGRPNAPKSSKNLFRKINRKEWKIAMNSALTGAKGKLVFSSDILNLKSKDFFELIKKVFGDEKILKKKTIRAGKGKSRGRKYKSNAGLLFVIGSKEEMKRKGIDVLRVNELSLGDLTLVGNPGRLVCYSENAIREIGEVFVK